MKQKPKHWRVTLTKDENWVYVKAISKKRAEQVALADDSEGYNRAEARKVSKKEYMGEV